MTDYIALAHELYEIAQSAQTEEEAQAQIAERIRRECVRIMKDAPGGVQVK